jgi:ferritin-like metal-binding protein YciE
MRVKKKKKTSFKNTLSSFRARLLLTICIIRYYQVSIGLVFSIYDPTEVAIQKMIDASQRMLKVGDHQRRIEQVMQAVSESEGLDEQSIREHAEETSQKASQMMQTYLGENPDTLDALEFLCLAEAGEVTHYEVLDELAKKVKDKKFASEVKSILREEKQHLQLCTQLARKKNNSG